MSHTGRSFDALCASAVKEVESYIIYRDVLEPAAERGDMKLRPFNHNRFVRMDRALLKLSKAKSASVADLKCKAQLLKVHLIAQAEDDDDAQPLHQMVMSLIRDIEALP